MSQWNRARLLKLNDDDFPHAATLWQANGARFVYCSPTAVEVVDDAGPRLSWRPATGPFDPARCWLLDADRAWFACPADDVEPGRAKATMRHLREVWPLLGEDEVQAAVSGVALAAWHRGHGYCSACGNELYADAGGWARTCTVCESQHFPRIDPAIIVALIDNQDRLLLGGQPTWGKMRSVFAGYVMAGESLEQAVHREVGEEVGLAIDHVRYFGSQPWPFPRSVMVAFTAHVENPDALHIDGREIVRADWYTRDEVRQAYADGCIDPPSPASIARRMIETWLAGDLS